ncbi:Rrf2 family transcriptional regulator [Paraburkholderia sp.]|uniref:Rrf2 family transcriptional regulator n=1 Tax=Paraburkholderia sp. TaxID=1926495 RepID=UPI0039E2AF48
MRLTDYTDYALRVLLYLAVRGDGLATIQDISQAYGISKNHLMKVVQQLSERGWVETVRGRHGGLRLGEQALALTVGDVVRLTENDFALVGCLPDRQGEQRACVITSHCRLRGALLAARDAFLAELDRYTIAEVAQPQGPLASLLGLGATIPILPVAAVSGGSGGSSGAGGGNPTPPG